MHLELPDTGDEGEVEDLGRLGSDLAGVGVHRVATDQHEIEGPLSLERGGQRPGGGQRVRAGERRVRDEDAVVGSPGDGLPQHVLGAGRTEREHRAGAPGLLSQLDALADRSAAVGVHLELQPIPDQPAVGPQLHGLEGGYLLHQGGDAHGRNDGSRFGKGTTLTIAPYSRRARGSPDCARHRPVPR